MCLDFENEMHINISILPFTLFTVRKRSVYQPGCSQVLRVLHKHLLEEAQYSVRHSSNCLRRIGASAARFGDTIYAIFWPFRHGPVCSS